MRIEAEVDEGPLFRLAEFKFTGNQAFSADELRDMFSLHSGDVFEAEKVRLGLQNMREQYTKKGYLECAPTPIRRKRPTGKFTVDIRDRGRHPVSDGRAESRG